MAKATSHSDETGGGALPKKVFAKLCFALKTVSCATEISLPTEKRFALGIKIATSTLTVGGESTFSMCLLLLIDLVHSGLSGGAELSKSMTNHLLNHPHLDPSFTTVNQVCL